ncbi:unnamed protein product [Parnassius mnemosyne]|uniref:Uncharacterized protein n=1 Tax=Parnassius mnemosyne TaxID=213953 RepID=A0AAV1KUJ0_9NEOP
MSRANSKASNSNASAKLTKKIITSPQVYKPVGPYSHAVLADRTLYVSGVLGLDASSNMICGVEGQARQALCNLKLILEAGDSSLRGVVKTTILLACIEDLQVVNPIYAEFFPQEFPARAAYQVARLPLNACIEIEAVALSGEIEVADGTSCPCARTYI